MIQTDDAFLTSTAITNVGIDLELTGRAWRSDEPQIVVHVNAERHFELDLPPDQSIHDPSDCTDVHK